MIRKQPGPQTWCSLPQRFQDIRWITQHFRCHHPANLPRQAAVQTPRGYHQHRLVSRRVPQGIAAVPQGGQLRDPPIHTNPDWQQLSPNTMPCSRPEYNRQNQIGRGGGNQQNFGIHICIENAVYRWNRAASQQPQGQYTACHGAGDGKQQ